ncbi:MAG: dienelactone hydrolase family protein [Burkholderiaceae bacterium]|jgi:carboxymethylenebutenolidase|nr:dienelactone hydrolase family protein [Burkholderiaceae bacterium]MCZ8175565.1 dienelactone hydrolase family protein [Burkholderiaceae bacterium]
MVEFETDIPTPDGAMNIFVVHPEEGGPHSVVLFYVDAHGWRDELRDICRRLASVGYCVLLPNLYYRRSLEWYPGSEHGFVFPRREGIYHRPSAERH